MKLLQSILEEEVAELIAFGAEVFGVMRVGLDFEGYVFYDFEAVADEADAFFGVIGHEADFGDIEVAEDLGADAVIALVGAEAEGCIGFDGVHALLLEFVGFEFIDEADAASFLLDIEDSAASFLFDALHSGVELVAAIAAEGAEYIAGRARGVDADEDGLVGVPVAFFEYHVSLVGGLVVVGDELEVAVIGGHFDGDFFFDEGFFGEAVFDKGLDRDDFEVMLFSDLHEVWEAGHGAVFVEDFDENASGVEACEAGEVNGCLCMSGAAEYAAIFGDEGEDVAGAGVVAAFGFGFGHVGDAGSAVVSRDAGGTAEADEVDGDGEGGLVEGCIFLHHVAEVEFAGAGFGDRRTDEAATEFGHKINYSGVDEFGGADEVAFIFAVFVIDDDNNFALADVFERFLDGVELKFHDGMIAK